VRGLLLALLATLVGLAMVGGGIWGLVDSVSDDDSSSSSAVASTAEMKTSSADDCSQVAERDPRFRLPHDLQFGGEGSATVQCNGSEVTFTIELDGLRTSTFYEVILERGRRRLDVGTILAVGTDSVSTVTIDTREVKLRKYDFLTVRPDHFHNPEVDQLPFRAVL
jgi:hypothetical protein